MPQVRCWNPGLGVDFPGIRDIPPLKRKSPDQVGAHFFTKQFYYSSNRLVKAKISSPLLPYPHAGCATQFKKACATHALQQFLQVFGAQARVAHDAFQDFGMEDFRRVKGNRSPLAFGILVDHVAATLARYRKTQFFQYGTDFARSQAWELRH